MCSILTEKAEFYYCKICFSSDTGDDTGAKEEP